ncbi:MAG: hypothetical protein ABIN58_02005 [candidate division WOR-3 bacterium]
MNETILPRTEHLFLLVGTNPLPNYIAARLLLKQDGHICPVHTDETAEVANRLIAALQVEKDQVTRVEVKEGEGNHIFEQVAQYVQGKQDIGLNYTGGTKTMAVHAYRAVEKHCPGAVLSYLDARTLSLSVETSDSQVQRIPVGSVLQVSLSQMLGLHGYLLPSLRQTPNQPEVCQALARIHSDSTAFSEWRKWLEQQSLHDLPDPAQYPRLQDVVDALRRLGNTPGDIAKELNPRWRNLEQCRKWFLGDWLEEYTLWACLEARSNVPNLFGDFGIDLKPQNPEGRSFQFDVALVRGYQLFAISCIASDKKEKCKEHLFEAYVRARQMGGDEARIGLVCCAPKDNPESNPAAIQREVEESWDAVGKVRVFGAEHLPNLPDCFRDWFNSQPS